MALGAPPAWDQTDAAARTARANASILAVENAWLDNAMQRVAKAKKPITATYTQAMLDRDLALLDDRSKELAAGHAAMVARRDAGIGAP